MSKSKDEIRNFLLYLENELREYVDNPAYAESAFKLMNDLADDIKSFLEEAQS